MLHQDEGEWNIFLGWVPIYGLRVEWIPSYNCTPLFIEIKISPPFFSFNISSKLFHLLEVYETHYHGLGLGQVQLQPPSWY